MPTVPTDRRMTPEEFLAFEAAYPTRYELVDGRPVHRQQLGWGSEHEEVRTAALAALHDEGRRRGLATRSDARIVCGTGNVRYADAELTCTADALVPGAPHRIVADVVSSDLPGVDFVDRLHDFDSVPPILAYLAITDDRVRVTLFRRVGPRLTLEMVTEDTAKRLVIPEFDLSISIADLYDQSRFGFVRVR